VRALAVLTRLTSLRIARGRSGAAELGTPSACESSGCRTILLRSHPGRLSSLLALGAWECLERHATGMA
jgi:hypothetical protein